MKGKFLDAIICFIESVFVLRRPAKVECPSLITNQLVGTDKCISRGPIVLMF